MSQKKNKTSSIRGKTQNFSEAKESGNFRAFLRH
jgi:hypothetical protein